MTRPLTTAMSRAPSRSKSAISVPKPLPRQRVAVSPAATVPSLNCPRRPLVGGRRAGAAVAEQLAAGAAEIARPAKLLGPLRRQAVALGVVVEVVDHHQIEPAVAVVIDERRG